MILRSKTAVVTGSTSGIGLALARGFAKEGANVVINGFGTRRRSRRSAPSIESEFGVKALLFARRHDQAATRSPAWSRRREAEFGARRHSRQQCRHPACRADRGVSDREVGRDHRDQSVLRLPCDARRRAGHEGARMGPHHQHRLGACARRLALQVGLCRGQARPRGPHEDGGARGRDHGITVNCICPGYVWTPLVEKQIPDTMKARGLTKEQVIKDVLLEAQPTKEFVTVEQVAALARVPLLRRREPDHRRELCRWTAAGRRMSGRSRRRRHAARPRRAEGGEDRSRLRCRAAARTAPSPGACSTRCSRTAGSPSRRSRARAPAP